MTEDEIDHPTSREEEVVRSVSTGITTNSSVRYLETLKKTSEVKFQHYQRKYTTF